MEKIRNFCVIAHIDHGKSTLADRFLEITQTIPKDKMRPQFLDMMDLEREKGITIKMQPVRMAYQGYILNLIDTPGHVDFSYEVSRALACVEGVILLVDATQGIQAQTLANLELARKQNLVIIPAVNKIDSPQAKIRETKEELANLLSVPESEIFEISGKQGTKVEELLVSLIEKVPPPNGALQKPFRALIFDSKYDPFLGVLTYIRVIDGKISAGQKIYLFQSKTQSEAKEVGFFSPELKSTRELNMGEIGYIATGIKEPGKVKVGDTIAEIPNVEPLAGYQEAKPMVFASIYPKNPDDFENLKFSFSKLKLNDAAFSSEQESKEALGRGFRCGFLGTLHAEIISERLRREFGLNLVISSPSVVYKIINQKNKEVLVYSSADWPEQSQIKETQEPWIRLEVIAPLSYIGRVSELLKNLKGNYLKTDYFSKERIILVWEVPLRKIIVGFYDSLKSATRGYGSMNYQFLEYRASDLLKLDILIAGKKEEFLSKIVSLKEAFEEGKKITQKLKEILPAQLFSVPLQAALGGKIIARETLRSKGKDVIAPLYGGDYTRKRKLLEKQKKGKKELKEKGQLSIPPAVYLEIFKNQ